MINVDLIREALIVMLDELEAEWDRGDFVDDQENIAPILAKGNEALKEFDKLLERISFLERNLYDD